MWRSAVQVCLGLLHKSKFSILNHDWEPGGLAQLARAPALQAGGQRFESVILHYPENWMTKAQASVNPEPDTREGVYLEAIFDILTQARL